MRSLSLNAVCRLRLAKKTVIKRLISSLLEPATILVKRGDHILGPAALRTVAWHEQNANAVRQLRVGQILC